MLASVPFLTVEQLAEVHAVFQNPIQTVAVNRFAASPVALLADADFGSVSGYEV